MKRNLRLAILLLLATTAARAADDVVLLEDGFGTMRTGASMIVAFRAPRRSVAYAPRPTSRW